MPFIQAGIVQGPNQGVKVMPMGDSITAGGGYPPNLPRESG